jgi:hypothetical protein
MVDSGVFRYRLVRPVHFAQTPEFSPRVRVTARLRFLPGLNGNSRRSGRKKFMSSPLPSVIALLHGPNQPGIVARISNWIFSHGGDILDADQHCDFEENVFFQRVEWMHHEDRAHVRRLADAFGAYRREAAIRPNRESFTG